MLGFRLPTWFSFGQRVLKNRKKIYVKFLNLLIGVYSSYPVRLHVADAFGGEIGVLGYGI